MKDTCKSLQSKNIEDIKDYNYLVEFVHSPYAFSLSFLRDPTLIGNEDVFGQNKYKLNLDEELLDKFFEILKDIYDSEINQGI